MEGPEGGPLAGTEVLDDVAAGVVQQPPHVGVVEGRGLGAVVRGQCPGDGDPDVLPRQAGTLGPGQRR